MIGRSIVCTYQREIVRLFCGSVTGTIVVRERREFVGCVTMNLMYTAAIDECALKEK